MAGKIAQAKPESTVEGAETEADEAQSLVDALEERIRSGDGSVAPDDLAKARGLAEFARLQCEAARRRAEQAARDAAAERLHTACEAARAFAQTSLSESERLRVEAAKALAAYMDEADRMSYQASAILGQLESANLTAESHHLPTGASFGIRAWQGHLSISTPDGELQVPAKQLKPIELLTRVLADVGLSISPHTADPVNGQRPWPPEV